MRAIRVVALVCVCGFVMPAAARAQDGGWLEWLEKLSGPGPFRPTKPYVGGYVGIVCSDGDGHHDWFCFRSHEVKHIVEARYLRLVSFDNEPRFFDTPDDTRPVFLQRIDGRYYYRFHRALDGGFGAGAMRFSGIGKPPVDFAPFWKPTVTPASVVFFPAAFFERSKGWQRVVSFQLEETLLPGIDASIDFGPTTSRFKSNPEFLSSFSIRVDLSAVAFQLR